jgi:hypothetical protein
LPARPLRDAATANGFILGRLWNGIFNDMPIATLSAADPVGFGLGIGRKIFDPLSVQWSLPSESLGYPTLYLWIADQDLMIAVETNSQQPEGHG